MSEQTERDIKQWKKMPTSKLLAFVSGDKPTSYRHQWAKNEIERRKSRGSDIRSWIALVISIAAFVKGFLV